MYNSVLFHFLYIYFYVKFCTEMRWNLTDKSYWKFQVLTEKYWIWAESYWTWFSNIGKSVVGVHALGMYQWLFVTWTIVTMMMPGMSPLNLTRRWHSLRMPSQNRSLSHARSCGCGRQLCIDLYSLFALRILCYSFFLNGEQCFLRVNRLYRHSDVLAARRSLSSTSTMASVGPV